MSLRPQASAAEHRRPLPFAGHPRAAAVTAAVGISTAAVLFVLSEASPSTATFFRCLYALPLLWWLMRREGTVVGRRSTRARGWAMLAGVFFAGDLLLFRHAILLMGAGLATVLVNLQVVIVMVAAWAIWGERPSLAQAMAVPIALGGVHLHQRCARGRAIREGPGPGLRPGHTHRFLLLLLGPARMRRSLR